LSLLRVPAPRWDVQAQGAISGTIPGLAATKPGAPRSERVSQPPPDALPADRAALIAWRVIQKHVRDKAFHSVFMYAEGPTLVRTTFPDGNQRLAWRRISLVNLDSSYMIGTAASVYLDARTGEPLALVQDIYVSEPSWGPLFFGSANRAGLKVWLQISAPLVLLALYLVTVLLIVGMVLVIRHLRARRATLLTGG
jgi:hypothetical protein